MIALREEVRAMLVTFPTVDEMPQENIMLYLTIHCPVFHVGYSSSCHYNVKKATFMPIAKLLIGSKILKLKQKKPLRDMIKQNSTLECIKLVEEMERK